MPQLSGLTFSLDFPVHLSTPLQVRGPLYRYTAMLAFPLAMKALTNNLAVFISALKPFLPILPLPSRSNTTSTFLSQANGTSAPAVSHNFMLQFSYCNLLTDHS